HPLRTRCRVAQTEARSLLDSPCLNQLFCSSASSGSIEDAAFLLAGQLPQLPRRFDFWRRGWSPTAGPNCAGFLVEQLDGSWPKCCRRWAAEFPAALLLRQAIAPLSGSTEGSASRLLRRHLDLYKALAPYDETVCCCRRLRRSLAMQPWWTRRNTDLVQAYPCSSAMLLLLSIHYGESPHPDGCRIRTSRPSNWYAVLLKHVVSRTLAKRCRAAIS
uniref:Ras-GEF domain-containing protein n=1 Tax=Macrostomum lignano TaxID=282301 RepID=A0A1I8F7H1_9PLAT